MSSSVAIDFGASFSRIGLYENGSFRVIPCDGESLRLRSCVAFTSNGLLFGEDAFNQAAANPRHTIFSPKRFCGRKYSDIEEECKQLPYDVACGNDNNILIHVEYLGQKISLSPEEICSLIFSKLKHSAEKFLNKKVTNAILSVPVDFNAAQRNSVRNACEIAGFVVDRCTTDTSAASLFYAFKKENSFTQTVLFVDFGGDSFSAAVALIEEQIVEITSVCGDSFLGGEYITKNLVNHFAKKFDEKHNCNIFDSSRSIIRLRKAVEEAKCALSNQNRVLIEIDSLYNGNDLCEYLSRSDFEAINDSFFRLCLEVVEKTLRNAQIEKSDIFEVVLVGGSSRIQKIQDIFAQFFSPKQLNLHFSDNAVLFGDSVYAQILSGTSKFDDVLLLDVVPHSIGVESAGGVMTPIIRKCSTIPLKKSQVFSTYADNQESVSVKIFEGNNQFVKDNLFLGRYDVSGYELAPKGVPKIEIAIEVDACFKFSFIASDQATQKRISLQEYDICRGLNSKDIQSIADRLKDLKLDVEFTFERSFSGDYSSSTSSASIEVKIPQNNRFGQHSSVEEFVELCRTRLHWPEPACQKIVSILQDEMICTVSLILEYWCEIISNHSEIKDVVKKQMWNVLDEQFQDSETRIKFGDFFAWKLQVMPRPVAESSASTSTDSKANIKVGNYQVISEIHRGHENIVFHVKHSLTDIHLAMKLFSSLESRNRERDCLEALPTSPFIVLKKSSFDLSSQELESLSLDKKFAFACVFEFGEGSLEDLSSNVNLSRDPTKLRSWIHEAAVALQTVHRNNLVHCDVKPSNYMFFREDRFNIRLKLIDFDCCRRIGDTIEMHEFAPGTPMFAPRDVLYHNKEHNDVLRIDPSLDVYSFGAVAYYLLTGSPLPVDAAVLLKKELKNDATMSQVADILLHPRCDLSAVIKSARDSGRLSEQQASMLKRAIVDLVSIDELLCHPFFGVAFSSTYVRDLEQKAEVGSFVQGIDRKLEYHGVLLEDLHLSSSIGDSGQGSDDL